jgi:hypothetical protein
MSTELFRKYIDILKEASEETVISSNVSDLDKLVIALTRLESVLDKYRDNIQEDQLLEIDLSQMSRAEIEALRNGTAAGSTPPAPPAAGNPISRFVSNNPTIQKIRATSGSDLVKGGAKRLGQYVSYGVTAYEILSHLYDWLTKKEFKNLAPVDQRTIRENIPILQQWTAPDKLKTLEPNLRLRLFNVVELLQKLGMSLNVQSPVVQNEEADAEQPQATEQPPNQRLLSLIDKAYADISESDQMVMKRFVLQNMHLLSEAEQMAVRRDMLNEIDLETVAWLGGGLSTSPFLINLFREWLVKLGADWAKTASAEEIIKKIAEIEEENRLTKIQNDNAERQWAARNARQLRSGGKPLDRPTLKPLTPLPEMPKNVPKPPGFLGRFATNLLTKAVKNPVIAAISGAAAAAGVYTLMYAGAATKAVNTADEKVKEWVAKNQSRYEMFKEAAKMTDDWFAGLAQIDPGRLLEYFKIEMDYCSAFPDEPICQGRMEKICADPGIRALNNGVPLDGCKKPVPTP